jgi:hypothetical protein
MVSLRREVMMSKAIGVFATMALIITLIGMWLRFALVTTEAVEVQAVSNAISPFELTVKNGKSLPDCYHGGDYTHVYRNR